MARLKVFRGTGARERVGNACLEGEIVCGTVLHDGEPAYYLMPGKATDTEVRNAAFAIREGRDMGESEHQFIAAYQRHLDRTA